MPVSQVDQDIDRFITAHPDRNFDKVLEEEERWSVFFQLTDLRAGLFGWYEMPPDADVLEIGSGFGALTGVLCEHAAHVTATERSLFRARAIAKACHCPRANCWTARHLRCCCRHDPSADRSS